jgi:hypothetical protein
VLGLGLFVLLEELPVWLAMTVSTARFVSCVFCASLNAVCMLFHALAVPEEEPRGTTYWIKSASALDEALIGGVEPVTFFAPPLVA